MEYFKNILAFMALYTELKLLRKNFDSEGQYRDIIFRLRHDFELCRMLLPEFSSRPLKTPMPTMSELLRLPYLSLN